jgi:hypothetical protein
MTPEMGDTSQMFLRAARGFVEFVESLDGVDLTGRGPGDWDLRSLKATPRLLLATIAPVAQ